MIDFLRFARGEPIPVEVGAIERELSVLWQQAGQAAPSVVSRTALWNVVMPVRGRAALAATKQLVDEMAGGLPTRAITLCLEDGGTGEVEATIESNVVAQPGGTRVVYSEEITLVGPVRAEAHFGALVRALQIPGVPLALFWIDPTLPSSLLTKELLPSASRLIVDTTICARPEQLFTVQQLAARAQTLPVADLGWLRLGPVRSLFTGLFDPPIGGAPLAAASRVVVRHRAGCDASALLLVAWLGVRLDWRPLGAVQTSDGGLRLDFQRGDAPGRAIAVHMVPSAGACGRSGFLGLELYGDGARYAVTRTAIDEATVEAPIAPAKVVKLDAHADAELCVDALGRRGRDPLFARCLELAGRLWSIRARVDGKQPLASAKGSRERERARVRVRGLEVSVSVGASRGRWNAWRQCPRRLVRPRLQIPSTAPIRSGIPNREPEARSEPRRSRSADRALGSTPHSKMIVLQGNWKSIVFVSGLRQLVQAAPTSSSWV